MAFNNNALYIIMNTADPKCRNRKNVKSIFNPILNLINFMVVTSPCTHAQAGTTVQVCLTTYYTVKRENLAHSYLTANQLLIHWPELVLAHPFQKIKTSEQV